MSLRVEELESPAEPGSLWPCLAAGSSGGPDDSGPLNLLWTVPGPRNALVLASPGGGGWTSEPVVTGEGWFVNWADFPQVALGDDGVTTVAWLEKLGTGTFAYGVRFARGPRPGSGAQAWTAPRWIHGDRSETEHGFVSLTPLAGGEGAVHALWLDGRNTGEAGGPMALYGRILHPDGTLGPETCLDDRVCDCCQTDAARLADGGVLAAWRDRSDGEVRDIAYAVGHPLDPDPPAGGGWTEPAALHPDGWHIPGCPVNGPAVAAHGSHTAIVWFTQGERGVPRVLAAIGGPAGPPFGAPQVVDDGRPLGRVDALFLEDGRLLVVWLESRPGGAEWRARTLDPLGGLGESVVVAEVSGERSDGFLRLARFGGGVLAAFVDADGEGVALRRVIAGR